MEDLSLHILDIMENSIRAGARTVSLRLFEDEVGDLLTLEVADDGKGMDEEALTRALDPFFTTKERKRFGLGLPLLAQAAEATGGGVTVESRPGQGTRIRATFHPGHVDMKPLGDVGKTLALLQAAHPEVCFSFEQVEEPPA
jgi:signal transduction histidine kinase